MDYLKQIITSWTIQSMEFSRPEYGVGSLSLLQGIFPTQGSNPGLLHCRYILYQLSHKRSLIEYFDDFKMYFDILSVNLNHKYILIAFWWERIQIYRLFKTVNYHIWKIWNNTFHRVQIQIISLNTLIREVLLINM